MYDQPPFPTLAWAVPTVATEEQDGVGVVVPTRNRPDRLERCLDALAAAREGLDFQVYVCDSSGREAASRVAAICRRHAFAELISHDRVGAPAARNVGVAHCRQAIVVSVDDDVYVQPNAIAELVRAYRERPDLTVVAGTVDWGAWASEPLVMRAIGYPRRAGDGEEVQMLISAMVLYPRALALRCPWNERLWPYDDLFASHLWRLAGAKLRVSGRAQARHDATHSVYSPSHAADHIYTNLFDAAFVTRSPTRLAAFESLGLAASAKHWVRSPRSLAQLLAAWIRGHVAFLRDLGALRRAARMANAEFASESGAE